MAEALKKEQNYRIFFIVGAIAIILGITLKITTTEWAIIIAVISFNLAVEALNTAFEELLNMISPEHNGKAKIIKDIAAGAVLVSSVGALVVALMVFLPKII